MFKEHVGEQLQVLTIRTVGTTVFVTCNMLNVVPNI